MKTEDKKKLSLSTETLRTLSNDQINGVVGAVGNITDSCLCGSGVCSIVGDCKVETRK